MTAMPFPAQYVDGDLVERAASLKPLLAENATRSEEDRQVIDANIDALEEAGLFDVMTPKRVGGLGATMATQLAVAAELGEACTSTAWVQTLLNVATWATARSAAAAEVFDDAGPRPRVAGVLAPSGTAAPTDGGYIVNGKWAFASGVFHANWAGGGVLVLDDSGSVQAPGLATMRKSEVTIEDTWFVAGMCGTASNTMVAENVFVPASRVGVGLELHETNGAPPEPGDSWPVGSVLALVLVGPILGAARACANAVSSKAGSRAISYTTYATTAESAVAITDVARASLDIDSAWLHAFQAAAYIDGVGAGAPRDLSEEARLRGQCGYLTDLLRQAVDTLLNVGGAGSFASGNVVQRFWRDINVASRHTFLATNPSLETYGRSMFGKDPIMLIV